MKPDVIGGLLGTATGILLIVGSLALRIGTPTSPEPGFFPFLGGVAILVLSLILVGRPSDSSSAFAAASEWRRPALVAAALIAQAALLDSAGYVLSTLLVAGVVMRALGVASWRIVAAASVTLSLGTYLLFGRILGVDLPAGVLGFLG